MTVETPAIRRLALLAALFAAGCVVQPMTPSSDAPAIVDPDDAIAEFVAGANRERVAAGCGALEWSDEVAAVAQEHSADMRDHDYFDHVDRQGRTPMQRVQAARLPVRAVAENIANGHRTGAAVLQGWLDSPGHRRNLLDCDYTHHGVGLAGTYWTHVLVRPAQPGPR
jgi:uncharacterized protein YkwD